MQNRGRAKVLLVDDNPNVRSFVRPALEDAGFDCVEAGDGWAALDVVESEAPDLVVLDIMLGDEDMNGLDVCKKIRERGLRVPVIFLTIKDRTEEPSYMEQAFRVGGDDYISKREELRRVEARMGLTPTEFLERKSDIEELLARIKARLPERDSIREFDNYLRIDLAEQQVFINHGDSWEEVRLAPKEFSLLEALMKNIGRPVGLRQLIGAAGLEGEKGALYNHFYKLRQKLERDPQTPRYIQTYHKIGYRFSA
ncbi:MAG: response regulator transcription factor [Chloroflexi bacterium]|nr:response regulator transcription factor [Chloroflexota bacterium]